MLSIDVIIYISEFDLENLGNILKISNYVHTELLKITLFKSYNNFRKFYTLDEKNIIYAHTEVLAKYLISLTNTDIEDLYLSNSVFSIDFLKITADKVDTSIVYYLFRQLCVNDNPACARVLLKYVPSNRIFYDLTSCNRRIISLLLDIGVKPTMRDVKLINIRNINLLRELLLRLECFDASPADMKYLIYCRECIDFDPEYNYEYISLFNYLPLRIAAVSNNSKFLIKCLNYKDIKLAVKFNNNYIYRILCSNGNYELVKSLTMYVKIENSGMDLENTAFFMACASSNLKLVNWILEMFPPYKDLINVIFDYGYFSKNHELLRLLQRKK